MKNKFSKNNLFEYEAMPCHTFVFVKKDIADEMLDALIKVYLRQCEICPERNIGCGEKYASPSCDDLLFVKHAIEKATGKPIDQILKESQNG